MRPQAQAAANAVVSNVPGAAGITIGGTRASAADPGGHPSGLALDYMVLSNDALGDAIVAYHIAHWDELGVEYIIWQAADALLAGRLLAGDGEPRQRRRRTTWTTST